MKLILNGKPGSLYVEVARLMSDRMDIPLSSFDDVSTLENFITVTDSVLNTFGVVNVYLTCNLTAVADKIRAYEERCNCEQPDLSNYNVVLDHTGMSADEIVDWLIDLYVSGEIFRGGWFIPAYLCIPVGEFESSETAVFDASTEFHVTLYHGAYLLHNNLHQAKLHHMKSRLLKLSEPPVESDSYGFDCISKYDWWFSNIPDRDDNRLLILMLAIYCDTMQALNPEQVLSSFSVNGNPVLHLIELGYNQ